MPTFEKKLLKLYHSTVDVSPYFEKVVKILFNQSMDQFNLTFQNQDEHGQTLKIMQIYDILVYDYYYDVLGGFFFSYVLKHHRDRFKPSEIIRIEGEANSHLNFYEVLEVLPGKGFYAQSLFDEQKIFINDVASSQQLAKWDVVMLRAYSLSGNYFATGILTLFSQKDKAFLTEQIRSAFEKWVAQGGIKDFGLFCKHNWPLFFEITRKEKSANNMKLVTPYGLLQFCTLFFKVKSLNAILQRLHQQAEFCDIQETSKPDRRNKQKKIIHYQCDWVETPPLTAALQPLKRTLSGESEMIIDDLKRTGDAIVKNRILGMLHLDAYLLRIEVRSAELAEFARTWFESTFGDAIQFKRLEKKDMEKIFKEKRTAPKEEEAIPEEIKNEMLSNYLEEHYFGLLDQKIPALDNHTPREASKSPRLRPLLEAWLRYGENLEERKRLDGQPYFPMEKLRKELGM